MLLAVEFHERRHPEVEDLAIEASEMAVVEALSDEQNGIGTMSPGLDHLIGIDDELFAKHWQRHRLAGGDKVGQTAAEALAIGQHRDRCSPSGGVAPGDRGGLGPGPDFTGRRAAAFEFSNKADAARRSDC